jgi:hypothetical protein
VFGRERFLYQARLLVGEYLLLAGFERVQGRRCDLARITLLGVNPAGQIRIYETCGRYVTVTLKRTRLTLCPSIFRTVSWILVIIHDSSAEAFADCYSPSSMPSAGNG